MAKRNQNIASLFRRIKAKQLDPALNSERHETTEELHDPEIDGGPRLVTPQDGGRSDNLVGENRPTNGDGSSQRNTDCSESENESEEPLTKRRRRRFQEEWMETRPW